MKWSSTIVEPLPRDISDNLKRFQPRVARPLSYPTISVSHLISVLAVFHTALLIHLFQLSIIRIMLCQPCQYVLGEIQKSPDSVGTFPHHASIGDWEKAMEQKCLLCRRLDRYEIDVEAHTSLIARTSPEDDEHEVGVIPFTISTDTKDFSELCGNFWLCPIKNGEGLCSKLEGSPRYH